MKKIASVIRAMFSKADLIPAIIQDGTKGRVLMLGYMNKEALAKTLATGEVWFYSRSRGRLWKKGERSGHTLRAKNILIDCDSDTILVQALPVGPVCHQGYATCFYRALTAKGIRTIDRKVFNPEKVYGKR